MLQQRMIGGRRFFIQHVRGVAAELAAVQCVQQIALMHEFSARRIHQQGTGLHNGDALGLDQMLGLLAEVRVQADDIALG